VIVIDDLLDLMGMTAGTGFLVLGLGAVVVVLLLVVVLVLLVE